MDEGRLFFLHSPLDLDPFKKQNKKTAHPARGKGPAGLRLQALQALGVALGRGRGLEARENGNRRRKRSGNGRRGT